MTQSLDQDPFDQDALIRFENLGVSFGATEAVRDVSLLVRPGETAAIVGETGSGKSVTMLAALGLLPAIASVTGRVLFEDQDLLSLRRRALDKVRGKAVSIVFQEPQSALDPYFTVGSQIAAVLRFGKGLSRGAAWARAVELVDEVGIAEAPRRAKAYPHELSGGQRQRIAIAMAIACEPRLLIADEPTTALDQTVATRILALLADLKQRYGMALILISHDLGLVRRIADTLHVMQDGMLVESGPADLVATRPAHAYTKMLLDAETLVQGAPDVAYDKPLLRARNMTVRYGLRGGFGRAKLFKAVDRVSLEIGPGETLGLIGESGSGKSTLGRALLRLIPSAGRIVFDGRDLRGLSRAAMRPLRGAMQIVFQDPYSSLSPRLTVGAIVAEGLSIHEPGLSRAEREDRALAALSEVGLDAALATRLPHELSGGQRQRVAIARVMVLSPRLVVLDEPTSALDRSVQAEVLGVLRRLQSDHGLSYLFITHDLAVVRAMATRVAVMKDGVIVETGRTLDVLDRPREDYTRTLVQAVV